MTGTRGKLHRAVVVPDELAGERADKAAALLFDDFSRAVLSRWIAEGALTVDGQAVKPRQRLIGGETLTLDTALLPREDWASAQAVDFEVVYEDEDLLVVDKPAGLVVHPGAGNPDGTLVNGLIDHRPELARQPRAGIIHRLDKDTSGLLVVAASSRAHTRLVRDLQQRLIQRIYAAVAEGRMVAGRDIEAPIGRDPRTRTRQRVREDGKPALTKVRVVERYRAHTLIEAELATGRTHQIRVHLASIGHPLVGDRRYGARGRLPPGASAELIDLLQHFPRQALHAWQLELTHPGTGERLHFDSPLPADLEALIEALRADAEGAEQ
ncbi:MAG TPA: 23S rRNA pseudouridine(1911/1915/1917) synthase RluD [Pseudomonadales bacterium]